MSKKQSLRQLEAAIDLLDGTAYRDASGDLVGVIYYAEETGRYYAVDAWQIEDLAARLKSGEPDAYSLWCSEDGADCPSARTEERARAKAGWGEVQS